MTECVVYRFSKDVTDGTGKMKDLLGGKGAGLAEMSRIGVRVPPGFTISTDAFRMYMKSPGQLDPEIEGQTVDALHWLEELLGRRFGSHEDPLLLSVRSGARVSMPGMMDTILNLGLNDQTVEGLATKSQDVRFAYDSYRRFIQMYANVVMGMDKDEFERVLERVKAEEGVQIDADISANGLKRLVRMFKDLVLELLARPFPDDPMDQLWGAIKAVFESWNTPRAKYYRKKISGVPESWGTAVNVQSMVFGNMGNDSGTGVCFTRNPGTGAPEPYGEFLLNAQGEDVVAGIRTPQPIHGQDNPESMQNRLPEVYTQLIETMAAAEAHFGDMQDMEFTVEKGKLFLLQTRTGKRTSKAALRIATDLCLAGMIDRKTAVLRIEPDSISQLLASEFDLKAKEQVIEAGGMLGRGLNAGPGAASGVVALTADHAVTMANQGVDVILVREETSPEDIAGMDSARGILTQRGGMTSHAAVVARGMGKPCVVGCTAMRVDDVKKCLVFSDRIIEEGEPISIDGSTGEVILGRIPTRESTLIQQLSTGNREEGTQAFQFTMLMEWADAFRTLRVRTNADTPEDAQLARVLGAEGIGLCRTEHMFFGDDRIRTVRKMILAPDSASRAKALEQLMPFQVRDFYGLFKAMDGLPVTLRLLDPPLHEFLPQTETQMETILAELNMDLPTLRKRIQEMHEVNPMLGHRGCRLGISQPAIYAMQVRAVVEAAQQAQAEGVDVQVEIMVPLITNQRELDEVLETIRPIVEQAGLGDMPLGTMIETPRAALTAAEIARSAAFFSFGTNDLTQCGMGISRDDSGTFLPYYLERGIYAFDPFKTIDEDGIGRLVQTAASEGRQANPDLHLGICGEHGGDPTSIAFFARVGLDYVSCSPFRVPIARLAAAHAALGGTR